MSVPRRLFAGSVGSYRPVIADPKLRENATTILSRGRALQGVGLQETWFTARIASLIGLTGLAGPDNDATISFGLPLEPEDSQYGKSRAKEGK